MKIIILNLLPWIVLGISVIGIIVIILRKIQVLLKLPVKSAIEHLSPSVGEKIKIKIEGLRYSSLQPAIATWLEKTLRKLRVTLLKLDNVFLNLIERAREKSQILKARSRAWVEHHRLKKIEKLQMLEKLDQAEVSETIEKAKKESKKEPVPKKEKDSTLAEEKKLVDLITKEPRNIEAYRKLGFLYLKLDNKEDAKNCFREVLKIDPDDLEVISKLKELD